MVQVQFAISKFLYGGLWTVILILALILEVIPVLIVVTMFSLAIGVPKGPVLMVIPIVALAIMLAACLIATKFTRRIASRSRAKRRVSKVFAGRDLPLSEKTASPTQYYRDLKRLG